MPFLDEEIVVETKEQQQEIFKGIQINDKFRIKFDRHNMWLEEYKTVNTKDTKGNITGSKKVWVRTTGFHRNFKDMLRHEVDYTVIRKSNDLVALNERLNVIENMISLLPNIVIYENKLIEVVNKEQKVAPRKENKPVVLSVKSKKSVEEEEKEAPKPKSKYQW